MLRCVRVVVQTVQIIRAAAILIGLYWLSIYRHFGVVNFMVNFNIHFLYLPNASGLRSVALPEKNLGTHAYICSPVKFLCQHNVYLLPCIGD